MLEIIRLLLDVLFIFYVTMWIVFPAYLANAVAVPVTRKLHKLHYIDGGRMFLGQRLFGDGKTVEGFVLASAIGIIGGIVQVALSPLFQSVSLRWLDVYQTIIVQRSQVVYYVSENMAAISRALLYPVGAMAGDLLGSFIKRRLRIPRGAKAPLLDQLDFIAGVILVTLPFTFAGWSFLQLDPMYVVLIIVLTPAIHLAVNKLAFRLRIKDVAH